jgi:hypothetical protein
MSYISNIKKTSNVSTYNVALRLVGVATVAVEKLKVLHILCVPVALDTQHRKRTRPTTLLSVACLVLPYFSTLSQRARFSDKTLLNIKCVLISSTNFFSKISHSKKNSVRYKKYLVFMLFLSDCKAT